MSDQFITFEGGEGAGKSTQIDLLAQTLQHAGKKSVKTREPGGTPEAEAIRNFIVQGKAGDLTPMTQALLHNAARAEHVDKVIKPYLAQDYWVLCDRFVDSTLAYQGYGYGLDKAFLNQLAETVCGGVVPGLTFILDLPVSQGLARVKVKQNYEALSLDFHERVRAGFKSIASSNPIRYKIVDASQPLENVQAEILSCMTDRFGLSFLK